MPARQNSRGDIITNSLQPPVWHILKRDHFLLRTVLADAIPVATLVPRRDVDPPMGALSHQALASDVPVAHIEKRTNQSQADRDCDGDSQRPSPPLFAASGEYSLCAGSLGEDSAHSFIEYADQTSRHAPRNLTSAGASPAALAGRHVIGETGGRFRTRRQVVLAFQGSGNACGRRPRSAGRGRRVVSRGPEMQGLFATAFALRFFLALSG